jgi:NTE family protein
VSAPSTIVDALRAVSWLAALPEAALEGVAAASTRVVLPAGATLYDEGAPSLDLCVVVHGRLRARRLGDEGPAVDREVGAGEPVGELGALTGEPRAATVVAVRDTEVVRVPTAALDGALGASPEVARALTRVAVERLQRPVVRPAGARTVALLPISPDVDVPGLAAGLADALGRCEVGALVVDERRSGTAAEVGRAVAEAEQHGHVVVLCSSPDGRAWDEVALRFADVVLLVGDGRARPQLPRSAVRLLEQLERSGAEPARELVLVHPPAVDRPRGTPAWLDLLPVSRHHHVRRRVDGHLDRLARHLLGRSIGVVLSGGGARAMAHLGAWRALQEAGVPVDHVGGSSIGGVLSVQLAMEPVLDEVVALDRQQFPKANFGGLTRATLPVVSLLSVRTAIPLFRTLFGELDLADTWIPSFVTTADFTSCELRVHDRGPAITWARATASPPGLWPPVADEHGHLHVDGGVLDNLPVLPMRRRGAGVVVAVDVGARRDLAVAAGSDDVTSWAAWARRRAGHETPPPSVPAMLLRLGIVTSLPAHAQAVAESDVVARPALDGYGMGAYKTFDPMVGAGYEAMGAALAEVQAERGTNWYHQVSGGPSSTST